MGGHEKTMSTVACVKSGALTELSEMIKQINEELSIKDSMRQRLTIKELFSRQFSKEAGKFAEEFAQRKVDAGATQSKKTFQEKVWGAAHF